MGILVPASGAVAVNGMKSTRAGRRHQGCRRHRDHSNRGLQGRNGRRALGTELRRRQAMKISRRNLLAAGGSTAIIAIAGSARWTSAQAPGQQAETSPDLIVHNAKVTTLQGGRPEAEAFAVRGERITAVGSTAEMLRLRAPNTRLIDAGSRRVIPGLNDSHFHIVRGGRDYNLELRWDGVESLHRGL